MDDKGSYLRSPDALYGGGQAVKDGCDAMDACVGAREQEVDEGAWVPVFLGLEEVEEVDESSKGGVPLGEEGAYGGEGDEGGGGDEGRVVAEDLSLCLDNVGVVLVCEDEAEAGAERTYIPRRRLGESCARCRDVCVAESNLGDGQQGVLLAWMEERGEGGVEGGVVEEEGGLVSGEEEDELSDHRVYLKINHLMTPTLFDKVRSKTRPVFLPPKPSAEDQKHLADWNSMMSRSRAAGQLSSHPTPRLIPQKSTKNTAHSPNSVSSVSSASTPHRPSGKTRSSQTGASSTASPTSAVSGGPASPPTSALLSGKTLSAILSPLEKVSLLHSIPAVLLIFQTTSAPVSSAQNAPSPLISSPSPPSTSSTKTSSPPYLLCTSFIPTLVPSTTTSKTCSTPGSSQGATRVSVTPTAPQKSPPCSSSQCPSTKLSTSCAIFSSAIACAPFTAATHPKTTYVLSQSFIILHLIPSQLEAYYRSAALTPSIPQLINNRIFDALLADAMPKSTRLLSSPCLQSHVLSLFQL